MPANQHLEWVEIRNFKGLWTNGGRFLMPTDALQVCSGAQPQAAGGLRAFWQPVEQMDSTDLATTGTDRLIHGLGVMPDADNDGSMTGNAIGNRYFVVTAHENGLNAYRLHYRQDDDAGPEATWNVVDVADGALFHDSNGSGLSAIPQLLRIGQETTGYVTTYFLLMPHEAYTVTPTTGIYELTGDPVGTELTRVAWSEGIDYLYLNALASHQARVVFGKVGTVVAGDPGGPPLDPNDGATTFVSLGDIGASHLTGLNRPDVSWILSVPPGDLLVGLQRGGIYNVQGDLEDPVVRELGRWGNSLAQIPVLTPFGPVVIFPAMGPRIVGADGSVTPLAKSLDPESWVPTTAQPYIGSMAFADGLLYAPNLHDRGLEPGLLNNGPLVHDFETGSWFTGVHPDVLSVPNPLHIQTGDGRNQPGVFLATGAILPDGDDTIPTIVNFPGLGLGSLAHDRRRAWKYEVTTAPFRHPENLELEIQELQLPVLGWEDDEEGGTVTLTITNQAGDAVSRTFPVPAGKSTIRMSLPMRGQYLEVNLVVAASAPEFEAPMIESLRLGHFKGHSVYQTPNA